MLWTDSQAIAWALLEHYPEVDPGNVRFTDLMQWVLTLPEFEDREAHCGERVLEAIQMAWIEEREN
ncbi:MAG: Fe-S cluster assembly protein IscX [Pseudomonadales bacterium]|nr:Fe-S cluster assembly protein IscX [Pseudomonadales bacterium]